MTFWYYVVRRASLTAFVLFGVSVVTFVLSHVVPADPVVTYLGDHAPPELVTKVRHEIGLDRPLPVQYAIYIGALVHGDLGISIMDNRPVSRDLAQYLPATVELATAAMLVAILIGVPAGIVSALYKDAWPDHAARIFALGGTSLPVFYLALLLLGVLYVKLGVLPGPGQLDVYTSPPAHITGMVVVDALLTADWDALRDGLRHLVLPALVLGYYQTGLITRMTRGSLLEVLRQDYVRTARAKGVSERRVVLRHALRNALLPTVTVVGLAFGGLLSGAVLTETIFSWPGIGRYATNSVTNVDIPAVLGVTLVIAIIYSVANLAVDLFYAYLDPQIRYT
ncbi:MAG TPA: ABC transporter permease [bacterium]|nr:ABC transporter permease [bacterium]